MFSCRHARSVMSIIDVVAILPYYIGLCIPQNDEVITHGRWRSACDFLQAHAVGDERDRRRGHTAVLHRPVHSWERWSQRGIRDSASLPRVSYLQVLPTLRRSVFFTWWWRITYCRYVLTVTVYAAQRCHLGAAEGLIVPGTTAVRRRRRRRRR